MNTDKVKGLFALPFALVMTLMSAAASAETTTVRWGPVHVPAMGHTEALAGVQGRGEALIGMTSEIHDYPVTKPCEDCYITHIDPNLVTVSGEVGNYSPNGLMLHHVVNMNWSNPDVTCRPDMTSDLAIKQLGGIMGGNERFTASGNERTPMDLSDGYGYYVAPGDKWGLLYHLMNMSMVDQDVYFEYTVTWTPASEFTGEGVRPIWVDIDQCNTSEVAVDPGYTDVHWDWTNDRTHKVTDIGGHVHDFGISTSWENATTGQTVCNSVAGYAEGSPYAPIGPGLGDDAHALTHNTVYSDPIGLASYQGHISDMTGCQAGNSGPSNAKGDLMRNHTQIYRPDPADAEMGILIGYMDEAFCVSDFACL